ncbi:calmodulin-binding transcription activator 1 [Schistocerca piceifrons]|uniref:calmodulin-binding transcription activator 1 n=1 Tax=Schistocerca piceifrons TaxID=274613 RepID=UPI001F5E6611|nr:calmodulin-binding transcription activator 1 [Schistocerca piceifrons]
MASSAVFCLSLQIRVGSDGVGELVGTGGTEAGAAGSVFLVSTRRPQPVAATSAAIAAVTAVQAPGAVAAAAPSTRAITSAAAAATQVDAVTDGEAIKLPDNLESLPKADHFPTQRHRWNTNEEIAAILISFDRHNEWQSKEVKIRPKSGSMLLYSRKKVRYRRDGYCWKKRKDGKTTREDHMKLKVQGTECIYGCYVHSAILPTFHRRCYWLLQNPDIVLVHYLNVPYPDDNKLAVITPSLALWGDKKEWTKEELVSQLKPMFFSEDEPDLNNELEISTAETVEAIVTQLMEKQRVARAAALSKQLECGCPDSTCADSKTCSHPMRRITAATTEVDSSNQVSSTTGTGSLLLSTGSGSTNGSPAVGSQTQQRVHRSSASNVQQNSTAPPLVLSLSQIQGCSAGSLLILNSSSTTGNSNSGGGTVTFSSKEKTVVLKQEAMDTSSCSRLQDVSNNNSSKMDVTNGNAPPTYDNSAYHRQLRQHEKRSTGEQLPLLLSSAPPTPSKHMDTTTSETELTSYCNADTVLVIGTGSSTKNNGVGDSSGMGDSSVSLGFFNETLDLSQEDIQRTLQANMPCGTGVTVDESHGQHQADDDDVIVSEINPMDFIDGCCDVVVSPDETQSVTGTGVDDDVFVNLDAFDMLGDFPELEIMEPSVSADETVTVHSGDVSVDDKDLVTVTSVESQQASHEPDKDRGQPSPTIEFHEGTVNITDYSPEWAYPEGGVKVLVTGPWYSTTSPYTVLFDTFPVPTTLVQSGVLRCYCPAHEVGLVTLQVACDGFVISNSVMFEYKEPISGTSQMACEERESRDKNGNDNLLRFTLLQRLEAMDGRLQIKQEPEGSDLVEGSSILSQSNFEDRLVNYCQEMTSKAWQCGEEVSPSWFCSHRGMTLLHLAASLGYSRLVCAMLHWREENSSLLLETEVDALSQDEDGYTPLMWACVRGHHETALLLYRWNHTALKVRNHASQTAIDCAREYGHDSLAQDLEQQEALRLQENPGPDDIFLRPDIVTILDSEKTSLNSELHVNIPPSTNVDSEMSTPNSNENGSHSSAQSPVCSSSGNGESNSSGTVQQRLTKRPSVDSGINLGHSSDSLSSLQSRGPGSKASSSREVSRLSRFDRSMSLPVSSPMNGVETPYDSISTDGHDPLMSSPIRRMDFALCEVATGARSESPMIDEEGVSDEDLENKQNIVGEQEVRVLTLAEQIIAAMPERIKNESADVMSDQDSSRNDSSAGNSDTLPEVFMEPLLIDETSSSFEPVEFNFEFSDHNYRYYDVSTPGSSMSPASSSCLQSPCSFTLDSPSPPPTTADFCEFFQASGNVFEKDFSNLTLSDREQRELYEAAKIIQKAYRSYKGRKKLEEQDKERAAAVLIQNYYRRYKQYAYFKQMTHAAMVIQNGFRSYCEHKRFKKSQEAAVCIQNYYRNYREQGGRGSRESTPSATSSSLKRTYSQRRQHQAARKIQQFMRQSKNKLQRERALAAEREKLEGQSVDALQKLPCPGSMGCSTNVPNSSGRPVASSPRNTSVHTKDAAGKT